MPGGIIGFILGSESYYNRVGHEHIHLRFEDYRGNGGQSKMMESLPKRYVYAPNGMHWMYIMV
jgi:hypothetical protein